MNTTKRSIFILVASGLLYLAPGVCFADLTQDCIKACTDQKASDDKNCQPSAQGADQGSAECLKNNQDIYNDCLKNCSPSSPSAATPKGTAPQATSPQGVTPQGATPQGATPQGATPQGVAPQGVIPQGVTPQGVTPPKTN